jgi:hypothetical protein
MGKKVTFLLWTALVLCLSVPVARGQSLWGYYPIQENDFNDYSGNNHHGTPVDGPATLPTAERGGWAVAFNAQPEKPSRINCGTDDPSAGGQLTVSAWVYWQGTNGNWQGIAGKSVSADDRRWVLQLRDSDGVIQWGGADTADLHIFASAGPVVDEWRHVVGTCDGANLRVYLNGEVVGEGPGGFQAGADAANVTLGFAEDRSDYDESFNGLLDDIYIFTRALSQDQVQKLATGVLPSFVNARAPDPADGSLTVAAPLLMWTAGDGAVRHNVYLGTTAELGEPQLVGPDLTTVGYVRTAPWEPNTVYYWRVDEIEADGTTIHTGDVWTFTAQALTAYHPDPNSGNPNVPLMPTLTWLPGQGAVQHHLYLSTNPSAVSTGAKAADKGLLTETSFPVPTPLQQAIPYYWRVDEVLLGDVVVAGPVWTFRTGVNVDDFESYTDEAGNSIFDVWVDGWSDNSNGGRVGYLDAPFCEQKMVHGGQQSMPFDYNNVAAPYYSEAVREFPMGETGAGYDIDTLVVYVHGRISNSPAPVYVGLQDAHGLTGFIENPDPNIVTFGKWTEWRVFMPQFMMTGVDLTAVRKMYLGVGDRNNPDPTPGGTGLVYIDDLRAIKTLTFDPSQFDPSMFDPSMFDPSQYDPNMIDPSQYMQP